MAPQEDELPKLTGTLNGRYILGKLIGEGKYGQIYKCIDDRNGQEKVAKCVLKGKLADAELNAWDELRRVHGLPPLLDDFTYMDRQVFVTDLYTGDLDKLRCRNRGKRFCEATVYKICYELVETLQRMHALGWIHRDVKPGNIALKQLGARTGRLVLIDLGIAVKIGTGVDRVSAPLDYKFEKAKYTTYRMSTQQPATETEDLKMLGYCLMAIRKVRLFGEQKEIWTEKKRMVENNPNDFLKKKDKFLLPLLKALFEQPYGQTPNYASILDTINSVAGPSFNHEEPMKVIRTFNINRFLRLK